MRAIAAFVLFAASGLAGLYHAEANSAGNMVPTYEVKLLMNPEVVLDSEHKLKEAVLNAFGMPATVTKMNVLFMDTDSQSIYGSGWIARIRKTEGEGDFELSYKKRYPIPNGDITEALSIANAQGFDVSDANYAAQIEWGYQEKTLSITNTKKDNKSGYHGMEMPSASDAFSLLRKNIPGKMDNCWYSHWGSDMLSVSRKYGPVLAKRSVGLWSGMPLYIEVWPIRSSSGTGTEYVVEASLKTANGSAAAGRHDDLMAYLVARGWFLAQDSLKTQMIMQRY